MNLTGIFAAALCAGINVAVGAQSMTASEAWLKVQHRYSATPPSDTVDTLKAGDPATKVTGIVTTFLDTMEVLQEAVRLGDNLIITHEPTFYNHPDETSFLKDDPVYKAKLAYIDEHHLVVYRLHDEIHPDSGSDPILAALYQALDWEKYPHGTEGVERFIITIPPTTLQDLAKTLEAKLHIRTERVDGNPALEVSHVAVLPGAAGLREHIKALNRPGVEVLIAGEASEWETVEYVRDAVTEGRKKGLILLGHEVSEEPGMEQCAKELRVLFPGVKIDHVVAGQALWSPERPQSPKLP